MAPSFMPQNAKVPQPIFIGFLWCGTAVSLCFVLFRLFVRVKAFRRLYWDDFLVVLAWVFFFATAVIWQTQHVGVYYQFALSSGSVLPTPAVLSALLNGQRAQLAVLVMFYSCLWAVKLSFLIFFRRLGQKVRGQKIWWWCVTGLTITTYITCIGTIQYPCLVGDLQYIMTQCSTPSAISYQNNTFHYLLAIDLITDLSIISVPVLILWNVRIPLKQKLGLIGIFSLTVVVMVFAVVRVVVVNTYSKQADITWLYFWTNMEMTVALIVSCLASFRQLFVKAEQSGHVQHSDSFLTSLRTRLLSTFRLRTSKSSLSSSGRSGSFFKRTHRHHEARSLDSGERIVPLDTIYVSHDLGVTSNHVQGGKPMPVSMVGSCYPTGGERDTAAMEKNEGARF